MRKTIAFAAGCAALSGATAHAAAPYFAAHAGAGFGGETDAAIAGFPAGGADLEAGGLGALAIGKGFDVTPDTRLSVEGEALYSRNDADGVAATHTTYQGMINVRYMLLTANRTIGPYVGAGVGYGTTEIKAAGGKIDDSGLAWQGLAGVLFGLTPTMALDVGYRYMRAPDIDTRAGGVPVSAEGGQHGITIGMRWTF